MLKDDGNSLVALRWRLNLFAAGVMLVLSCQPVTLLRLCLPHGVGTLGSQARKASGLPPTWLPSTFPRQWGQPCCYLDGGRGEVTQ